MGGKFKKLFTFLCGHDEQVQWGHLAIFDKVLFICPFREIRFAIIFTKIIEDICLVRLPEVPPEVPGPPHHGLKGSVQLLPSLPHGWVGLEELLQRLPHIIPLHHNLVANLRKQGINKCFHEALTV